MSLKPWIVEARGASDEDFARVLGSATRIRRYRRTPRLVAGWLRSELVAELAVSTALRFFPDSRLSPFLGPAEFQSFANSNAIVSPGLNQVVELIKAPEAWPRATGKEVYIAVVDSGINGAHQEFPSWKRAGGWSYDQSDPWVDPNGHGTMCAAIAAGSPSVNARLCGVAPDAKLYACKTNYQISEILAAYEWIQDQRDAHQRPVVVTNSFGYEVRDEPRENGLPIEHDHPLTVAIQRLVNDGIPMVFAAGNNHDEKQHAVCRPNTIWAWNSLNEVLTVAEVDQSLAVRPYSSRGPGQWAAAEGPKPDCAAPTFGWILFDNGYRDVVDGWGTSGAAPQAAGLLAMLLQQVPDAAPDVLYRRIRDHCHALTSPWTCVGSGLLDCHATLF